MAVDAQYYSENMGLAMCGLQDLWVNPVSSSGVRSTPPISILSNSLRFTAFKISVLKITQVSIPFQWRSLNLWPISLRPRGSKLIGFFICRSEDNQSSFLLCSLSVGFFEIGFCFGIEFCFDCLWKQIERTRRRRNEFWC